MSFAGWKNYSVTGGQWIEGDRRQRTGRKRSLHQKVNQLLAPSTMFSLADVFYSKTFQMIYIVA